MSALDAVALYLGLNLLILLGLAVNVGLRRRGAKIGIGDGGDDTLLRRIRVHGNATEWLPGALVGLLALALLDAPTVLIHAIGATLTLARGLHAQGLMSSPGESFGRMTGAGLTMLVYLVLAGALLWYAVQP